MADIITLIAQTLKLKDYQVSATIKLLDEGSTVPFISRYRKEATGNLDEEQIRQIEELLKYQRNLEERKQEILKSIEEQWKLTDELKEKILAAVKLQELEDLYAPYKKAKKTKADIAIENGLQPLADYIKKLWISLQNVQQKAAEFLNDKVLTTEEAIEWAKLIIAQELSQDIILKEFIRWKYRNFWTLYSKLIEKNKEKDEKFVYKDYYDFFQTVNKIVSHRILAVNRWEKEKILSVSITVDERSHSSILETILSRFPNKQLHELFTEIIEDSLKRLLYPSVETSIRNILTEAAEKEAIVMFKKNLHNLLMQAPIAGKNILWLDPWFRTGCKMVVVNQFWDYQNGDILYLIHWDEKLKLAQRMLKDYLVKYDIDIIAIWNWTASRETAEFVAACLSQFALSKSVKYIIVNEAWASVYSASKLAKEEFPDLDVTARWAISIARRVQDPLAELVKIDPQSIWVGMYQHDVNQTELVESLTSVVESAVNNVWVNVNSASWALLAYVSGLSKTVAQNVVQYRTELGSISDRIQLKKVKGLWPKAFEQAAGFIIIPWSKNPLDETIVHPESYDIAKHMLEVSWFTLKDLLSKREEIQSLLKAFDVESFAKSNNYGLQTCLDIKEALMKPRRDPRDDMPQPLLKSGVLSMDDLEEGMELEWTVRNVINFGAFVDIGLKNDALLHISHFPWNDFVKDPTQVLSVWQIITAEVLSVDKERGRVNLTMKHVGNDYDRSKATGNRQQTTEKNVRRDVSKKHPSNTNSNNQPDREFGGRIKFI